MASCREIKQANYWHEYHGRPSKNSQGICNMFQYPRDYTASQLDQQHTPVNTPLPRNVLTSNDPKQDSISAGTPCSPGTGQKASHHVSNRMTGLSTHQVHLQPGTIIICDKIPFVVSNNDKIYNFTWGSFKQLYVANPSKHKIFSFFG